MVPKLGNKKEYSKKIIPYIDHSNIMKLGMKIVIIGVIAILAQIFGILLL